MKVKLGKKEKVIEPIDVMSILALLFVIAVIVIIVSNKISEAKSDQIDVDDIPYHYLGDPYMPLIGGSKEDKDKHEDIKPIVVEYENMMNGIKFNVIDKEFSGDMKKEERGFYIDSLNQPNSPYYVYITAGQRSSAGYSLSVKDIEIDDDKTLTYVIEETKPGMDEMVATVITYPTLCIEMEEYPYAIKVVDTDGEEFKHKI